MTPSANCLNDMASCGNACCAAEFPSSLGPEGLFRNVTAYLESGGKDGLFNYTGGTGGLKIATQEGPWTATFQGTHTTFKARYVDTINFAIRQLPQGGSTVRVFSISNIAGALGDMGQNRRTVSLLGSELGLGPMDVLFGCGATPSLPALAETGDMWKERPFGNLSVAERNQQVVEQYFRGVFMSSDFKLNEWLQRHIASDGVFQFCPLSAEHLPANPYPHCTNSQGKEAYLQYVELDQKEFGDTRIANVSFATSTDGLEVFSRYMVTGTLQGQAVPWFDQVMAWTFDSTGQIKRTVFWSDTLYWNRLYEQATPATGQRSTELMSSSEHNGAGAIFVLLFACSTFGAGVVVGSAFPRRSPKADPLLSA